MSSALASQQPPSVPLSAYAALATLSIGVLSAFCIQCLCDTTHLALNAPPPAASAPLSTCVPWAFCIQRLCSTTHFVLNGFLFLLPRLLALPLCLLPPLLVYSQQRMPGDPKMDPHISKYKKKGKSRRGSSSLSFQSTFFQVRSGNLASTVLGPCLCEPHPCRLFCTHFARKHARKPVSSPADQSNGQPRAGREPRYGSRGPQD